MNEDGTLNYEKGNKIILDNLIRVYGLSINKNGKDFAFIAEKRTGETILVYNGKIISDWNESEHEFTGPLFIDNELASINRVPKGNRQINIGDIENYEIRIDQKTIYSFQVILENTYMINNFINYKGKWILEYQDNVIINGENIGKKNGYDKIFNYRILKDKPFYFFKKDGKVHISYNGEILSNSYDEVIHNKGSEPAVCNVRSNDDMIWFFALKDGFWYFVEAGIYEN